MAALAASAARLAAQGHFGLQVTVPQFLVLDLQFGAVHIQLVHQFLHLAGREHREVVNPPIDSGLRSLSQVGGRISFVLAGRSHKAPL